MRSVESLDLTSALHKYRIVRIIQTPHLKGYFHISRLCIVIFAALFCFFSYRIFIQAIPVDIRAIAGGLSGIGMVIANII